MYKYNRMSQQENYEAGLLNDDEFHEETNLDRILVALHYNFDRRSNTNVVWGGAVPRAVPGSGTIPSKGNLGKKLLNLSTAVNPSVFPTRNIMHIGATHKNLVEGLEIARKRYTIYEKKGLSAMRERELSKFRQAVVPHILKDDLDSFSDIFIKIFKKLPQLKILFMRGLLSVAIENNSLRVARFLLENGADANEETNTGYTPLTKVKSQQAADLLIEYGAIPMHNLNSISGGVAGGGGGNTRRRSSSSNKTRKNNWGAINRL
jgi:hypothetical protein